MHISVAGLTIWHQVFLKFFADYADFADFCKLMRDSVISSLTANFAKLNQLIASHKSYNACLKGMQRPPVMIFLVTVGS